MKTATRQNNFNLARLVLALLVVLGHSAELVDGTRDREPLTRLFGTVSLGELAVDGFFLLSGYLIVQSWESRPNVWEFLKKRLLRIYPGYLVACLICALIVGPLGADSIEYFTNFNLGDFLSSIAFLQLPAVPAVFQGQPHSAVNGAMWTISREFCCYLLVLVAGASGALRSRYFWLATTSIVFAVIVALKLKNLPIFDLRLASFFLSGGCFYLYREHIPHKASAACFAMLIAVLCLFSWRGAELGLATAGGYALLYVAEKRSALLSHFNRLPDVSYGVYLYGWPIQKLLLWYYPSMSPWALFAIAAPTAIVAGALSWYLIEQPALRLKGPSIQIADSEADIATPLPR